MRLSSYNVNQQLVIRFQDLLSSSQCSFSTLKSYLMNQEPIAAIHESIIEELKTFARLDKIEVRSELEARALEAKRAADCAEQAREIAEEERQKIERVELMSQLTSNRALETELNATLNQIHRRKIRSTRDIPMINVGQAPKIHRQLARLSSNNFEILSQLNQLGYQNEQSTFKRQQRAQQALVYQQLGFNINNALTPSDFNRLQQDIRRAELGISSQCQELIKEAAEFNYFVFVQQLERSLLTISHSVSEGDALQRLFALMKRYQDQFSDVYRLEEELRKTSALISSHESQLQQAQANVVQLEQLNAGLIKANEALVLKNISLESSQKKNSQWSNKLAKLFGVFSGAALVTSIPLILVLSGVLSFALAPALLFSLVSIVPALFLVTSIGLGIAALVHTMKASAIGKEIKTHEHAIESNLAKMRENEVTRSQLETETIPTLMDVLQTQAQIKTQHERLLQERQTESQQTFEQAEAIEPINPIDASASASAPSAGVNPHRFHQPAPMDDGAELLPSPSRGNDAF